MKVSGGEVSYRWSPVEGWLGMGVAGNFQLGGYMQTQVRHFNIGLGDNYKGLVLGTDVFDQTRYFSGRGIFVERKGEQQTMSLFAGATTAEDSYSFFRSFQSDKPTAAFFLDRKLLPKLSYDGFTVVQQKLTSIHSLRFSPDKDLNFGIAAGVGNNSPYASVSTAYQKRKFQLLASYSFMGDSFQRIAGVSNRLPEHIGGNARFLYQPFRNLHVSVGHEKLLSPSLNQDAVERRVSLDSLAAGGTFKGFNLGGGATFSKSGELHTRSQSYSLARDITRGISANGSVLHLRSNAFSSTIYTMGVSERILSRLVLTQGVSKSGTANNFTWAARFISNRATIGFGHDMVYTPLAGGFGGKSFAHMWMVNLNVRVFRGVRLHTDSMVDTAGRVRYSSWVDGIGFSRDGEQIPGAPTQPIASFSKFVVKGRVQDEAGKPIWGISVQVDGQNAYSDSLGRFFMRFRRGEQYPVSIVVERSLNPQAYEVVQAPVSALAEPEDIAQPIVIIVRKSKNPPPRRRSEIDTPNDPVVGGGGLAPESPESTSQPSGGGLEPHSSLLPPQGTAGPGTRQ